MASGVLELMAEGLGIGPADALSRLVSDAESDNMLRVNHYPPRPELQGRLLTGCRIIIDAATVARHFYCGGACQVDGISRRALEASKPDRLNNDHLSARSRPFSRVSTSNRSNSSATRGYTYGTVLTNGRFSSVKHRVVVSSERPRVSMIFFGGPPMGERLAPLRQLLGDGGRSKYREFTWKEYKSSTHKGRLATV
ncbi:hypothetical protein ZWY2020_004197 [Hordeum vulgare]|nr:hypothetical protein ZWY2020_004197 [Hordeum vulgare]